jgi:nicotinamide-nucleotide amidase
LRKYDFCGKIIADGSDFMNFANELVTLLKEKNLTISCAESCTGGLVAKSITDVSGCSSVFWGGVVSYDNSVKMGLLGVREDTLKAFGAVSEQTATEMALGVSRACKTAIGISTTGIAGPDGGSPEKPVGTVYIGVCIEGEACAKRLNICPSLSRGEIRERAVELLLTYLIDKIKERY